MIWETYRVPLVLGFTLVERDLRVETRQIVIHVLLVIDAGGRIAQASGVLGRVSVLDRADAETIAKEQLLVERRYKDKVSFCCCAGRVDAQYAPNFCICSPTPASVSRTRSCIAFTASGLVRFKSSVLSPCRTWTLPW